MLGDIKNTKLLYAKAFLFVVVGIAASVLIVIENPTVRTIVLLATAIWGFCRAYYFAFYVIEKYIDPSFKFSGLAAVGKYVCSKRRNAPDDNER